jgi:hypothetical protein
VVIIRKEDFDPPVLTDGFHASRHKIPHDLPRSAVQAIFGQQRLQVRHSDRGQDPEDGDTDDQVDHREAVLIVSFPHTVLHWTTPRWLLRGRHEPIGDRCEP